MKQRRNLSCGLKAIVTVATASALAPATARATTYNVATNFSNNTLWSNTATWNPNTGVPGSSDDIVIASGTTFATGNAVSLATTSRQISSLTYSVATLGMSFTGTAANVNLQVDGLLTKNGSSSLAFAVLGLTGSGGIQHNAGTVQFNSASTGTGTNQQSVTVAKNWTIGGAAAGDTPTINVRTTRSAANDVYTGNLTGNISFGTTTPNRVLTVNTQNTATSTSNINITGDLTGGIGAKEVTFSQSNSGANTTGSVVTIGGAGTTSFTSSTGSKFVVGRLNATNNNVNLDLVNGRANAFGGVDAIQLGDANVSPGGSNSTVVRLLSSVADTVEQKINVNGYTTASSQTFTVGGTHTSGLVTFSGPMTLSKPVSLLASASGAVTAFTGGITGGANAINITGSGTTAVSNTITGSNTVTVSSGGTITPGTTGTDVGTLTLSGSEDLTFSGGSNGLFHVASAGSFDKIAGIDALTYGGALSVDFASTFGSNAVLDLFALTSQSGNFSSIAITGAYTATLSNSGGTWTGSGTGAAFEFVQSTGDLTVTVPEPGSLALIALGGMMLFRRRNRR